MTNILITSFTVFAIWYTMLEGEIFGKAGIWFNQHLPTKLHQPVYDCPVCMVMWYGTAIYWAVWHVSVLDWLLTVPAAMGLNAVITKLWPKDCEPSN